MSRVFTPANPQVQIFEEAIFPIVGDVVKVCTIYLLLLILIIGNYHIYLLLLIILYILFYIVIYLYFTLKLCENYIY